MFTQGLAREVGGRAITVNNVQPGPIDTDLKPASGDWATPQIANTALNRYGTVEEVAALVPFVAGPEVSYITGANLNCRRGYQCLRRPGRFTLPGPGIIGPLRRNRTCIFRRYCTDMGRNEPYQGTCRRAPPFSDALATSGRLAKGPGKPADA
jgi:Enoyl-(Acyl carrier protein) reductase